MFREVEVPGVGYAVGAEGRVFLPSALDDHRRHLCHGQRRGEYLVEVSPQLGHRRVEVLRTGLHHHLLAQPPGPLACRQSVGLCRIGEREGNGPIAAGLEVEHRAQVLGRVTYYLFLPHVVALADGPANDGIQGRHHRTAALAGEGQQRCQRHVNVDDVLPRGSRAEQPLGQMEDVVLLGDELALRRSRCASPEDVLVAGEGVDAVGSRQAVIIHVAIEPQHGVEEGAHGPHVAKAVEHMEREATLAVADIEHQAPGLLSANVPRQSVGFTYHHDLLRLGVLHEESPPHDDGACPKIAVYPQGAHHRRPQFIGPHALRQLAFGLCHRGPPAGAAPVECLIQKIQFLHIFSYLI